VVRATDLHGHNLGFLDRSRYFFFQVPDPLLLRKSGSTGSRTHTSGSVARSSDHQTAEAVLHPFIHRNEDTTRVGTSHKAIHSLSSISFTNAEFTSVVRKSHRDWSVRCWAQSCASSALLDSNTEMYFGRFCCVGIAVNTLALHKDKEYLRFFVASGCRLRAANLKYPLARYFPTLLTDM
jgi:hypothetical protein